MGVKTTRVISTISYNSEEYLFQKLEELKKNHIISFYAFVHHLAEDDEGGKKDHNHLFIEPSKSLLTDNLTEELKEFDPNNPSKPKTCISWKFSKFSDWYLYSIHDRRYLALKQQSRKYHYSFEDVITSDIDDLNYRVRTIDLLELSPYSDMLDAQNQGLTFEEYFGRGTVPIPQVAQFERAWYLLRANILERSDRSNHEQN